MMRTHTAGELRRIHVGEEVALCGWVASRRDHKGRIFVDLRDRYGTTQCVFPAGPNGLLERGSELPLETCIRVLGRVEARPEGLRNARLGTGDVEVVAERVEVLGRADTPPFEIEAETTASEELRMRYRYLDLRREPMSGMLLARRDIGRRIRSTLDGMGFVEVETPILTRSTPEGARDYLVPSREKRGAFYALPQSPQLFKQLLMVAGMDRYYQVARCFRDEDLRADRQPEFTQIDVEMSFVAEEDVMAVMEGLLARLLREFRGVELETPFPRLTFAQAVARFGVDRPDLRYGLEIRDVTDLIGASGFRTFCRAIATGGRIRGIRAEGGASLSRRKLSGLEDLARENGGRGLIWLKAGEEGDLSGPAAKFLSAGEKSGLRDAFGCGPGDLLLMASDREGVVSRSLGAVRRSLAGLLDLVPDDEWRPVFIVDFPLLVWNEQERSFDARHHPFTALNEEDGDLLESDPGLARARAYDLVLNGVELGGGSIRNHRVEMQSRVFAAMGVSREQARRRFGFLLDALRFGAPPHGGFAMGFDRLVALLLGRASIREVIPFPKTTTAGCPLTSAPSQVSEAQLRDLGLRVVGGTADG